MDFEILLSPPDVRAPERAYLLDALDSGWLAPAGPHLDAFEVALAERTGRRHAVAVSSGTAAMHLALLAAGTRAGDDVLCSTFTFIGSVSPVVHLGANPVFIDSESESWNLDPGLLEDELTERARNGRLPRAVIVVDLYGVTANYAEIAELCDRFEVTLIEDAAESLGATFGARPAGSFGQTAVLSFNGNKIVTSSGGGALVTDDGDIAQRARYLATQARQPALHYEHTEVGYNYRMSNVVAAIGHAQITTLDERIARRREFHTGYREALRDLPGCRVMCPPAWGAANHWLTCVAVDGATAAVDRDGLIERLARDGIESRPVWKPMHAQPVFADAAHRLNGTADQLFETGVCLPSGSGMSDQQFKTVVAAVADAIA